MNNLDRQRDFRERKKKKRREFITIIFSTFDASNPTNINGLAQQNLTPKSVNDISGVEKVTLSVDEAPAHSHLTVIGSTTQNWANGTKLNQRFKKHANAARISSFLRSYKLDLLRPQAEFQNVLLVFQSSIGRNLRIVEVLRAKEIENKKNIIQINQKELGKNQN